MKIDGSEGVLLQFAGLRRKVTKEDGTTEIIEYHPGDPEYDKLELNFKKQLEPHLPWNFMVDGVGKSGEPIWKNSWKISNIFEQYYAGTANEKDLEATFSDIIADLRSGYADQGFDPDEFMPKLLNDVYIYAKIDNVRGAYIQSRRDSHPLMVQYNGREGNSNDTIYYDAKYYYQSEEMKDTLQDMFQKISRRYGVSDMEFPKGFESGSIYASYNTCINYEARMSFCCVGNMIDENLVPPKDFKFFYKGNDSCDNVYHAWLRPDGSPGPSIEDGVLNVWCGDWSFVGRVPVRQNGVQYKTVVNMYSVVAKQARNIPKEIVPMLKNFDFFSTIQSGEYHSRHPRKVSG